MQRHANCDGGQLEREVLTALGQEVKAALEAACR